MKRQVKTTPNRPARKLPVAKEIEPVEVVEEPKVLTPPKKVRALTDEQIATRNENLAKGRAKLEQMRSEKKASQAPNL